MLPLLTPLTSASLAVDIVALEAASGSAQVGALVQPGPSADPVLQRAAARLRDLSPGLDPASDYLEYVMALGAAGPLLLADTRVNKMEWLYPDGELMTQGDYRGVRLYGYPDSDWLLSMLPGALFASGTETALHSAIDRLLDNSGTADSMVIEALSAAISDGPVALAAALSPQDTEPGITQSLTAATQVSAALSLVDGSLAGEARFLHPLGAQYRARFNELVDSSVGTPLPPAEDDEILLPVSLPLESVAERFNWKQMNHGMTSIAYAEGAEVGGDPAWLSFEVGQLPNSIFINFTFKDAPTRARFEVEQLPPGFRMVPMRILEGEPAVYYLVLNIYQSSGGLVEGARAEWSVFVEDPETGVPRFMVVQAAAENLAADPVNLLTFPEPVSHILTEDEVASYVGVNVPGGGEELYFQSSFPWPQQPETLVSFDRQFAVANDYIFWGNAVNDRGVYNGSVYAREAVLIDPLELELDDRSNWAQYVNPQPRHTLSYLNALDIVISPWWNLDADYLDVTDLYRQQLVDFSNEFYPSVALGQAEAAFAGKLDVASAGLEGEQAPSIYFHLPVTDTEGLMQRMGLDPSTPLAAISPVEGGIPTPLLTLHFFEVENDPCGYRAEWLTYLQSQGAAYAETWRVASYTKAPCLDLAALVHPGYEVTHEMVGERSYVQVTGPGVRVEASVDGSDAAPSIPGLDWVESGDRVCSAAAFCDSNYYDGATLSTPLDVISPSAVDITRLQHPWEEFVDETAVTVIMRGNPRLQLIKPGSDIQAGPD
ncbi:MAG: hypothetical protein ABJ322_07395 [Marinobacter sp.]|uniref:hypothetical protein n=1 Tax=Marinobacter sp. TaxID=50741 RepID=UPI0032980F0C